MLPMLLPRRLRSMRLFITPRHCFAFFMLRLMPFLLTLYAFIHLKIIVSLRDDDVLFRRMPVMFERQHCQQQFMRLRHTTY